MASAEVVKRQAIVFTQHTAKRQKSFAESSSDESGDEDPQKSETDQVASKQSPKAVNLQDIFPNGLLLPPKSDAWGTMSFALPDFLNNVKSTNIHIQTAHDLEMAVNIRPLHSVFGLHEMKDLLFTRIAVPLSSPELFSFNQFQGKPIQHTFFFYGRHGAGVRTLIRSFCQDRSITLCEAFAPGFLPSEELQPLYKAACENAPAIVLLNDCDAIFMKNSPNVAPLWRVLKSIRDRGLPVWTIFRSQFKQEILDDLLQDQLSYSIFASVPAPIDRERLWCTALLRYNTEDSLPDARNLKMLCEISEDCNARNIFTFVECAMADKLANLGFDLRTYPKDHPQLRLTLDDLKPIEVNNRRRITRINPHDENVGRYIVPMAADNSKFNPHNRNVKQGTWS
jgi:hypothetical protein